VDTEGLLLHGLVTPASVQDRDGGILLLKTLFGMFPFLQKLFADSGYAGPIFRTAQKAALPNLQTEIIKRSDKLKGFVVLPRRWVVERTIGWLTRSTQKCSRSKRPLQPIGRRNSALGARHHLAGRTLPRHAHGTDSEARRCFRHPYLPADQSQLGNGLIEKHQYLRRYLTDHRPANPQAKRLPQTWGKYAYLRTGLCGGVQILSGEYAPIRGYKR